MAEEVVQREERLERILLHFRDGNDAIAFVLKVAVDLEAVLRLHDVRVFLSILRFSDYGELHRLFRYDAEHLLDRGEPRRCLEDAVFHHGEHAFEPPLRLYVI